jgi:SsrA-binding protein
MAKQPLPPGATEVVATNRKARFEYHILDEYEAGMVLQGTEVKSLRAKTVQLLDAYVSIVREEAWIYHLHIAPFEKGNRENHEPTRPRKLLMHKSEISRLIGKTQEQGLTVIPLRIYFKGGRAKIEIALAKGKKLYDKRADLATKDARRDVERALRHRGE